MENQTVKHYSIIVTSEELQQYLNNVLELIEMLEDKEKNLLMLMYEADCEKRSEDFKVLASQNKLLNGKINRLYSQVLELRRKLDF